MSGVLVLRRGVAWGRRHRPNSAFLLLFIYQGCVTVRVTPSPDVTPISSGRIRSPGSPPPTEYGEHYATLIPETNARDSTLSPSPASGLRNGEMCVRCSASAPLEPGWGRFGRLNLRRYAPVKACPPISWKMGHGVCTFDP